MRLAGSLASERGATLARVLAVAALVAAVALVALAMFGGGESYKVKAVFQSAGQLVRGNPVQVGGASVGSITDIDLNESAQAVITMELEDDIAPLHEGTEATIRATSLSGIANRYVSLQPGPNSREEIEDGGSIGADATNAPVDIDVLFNTLDARTRKGLMNVIRGSGTWYDNKGEQAAESTKYFNPFLVSTTDLSRELALDQGVFERFVTRHRRRGHGDHRAPRRPRRARDQHQHGLPCDRRRERGPRAARSSCCPTRCERPTPRS